MATYYVRSSGGNDGNTGLSFAQGWATIQFAADTVTTAGSVVLICADGTHTPTSTIDFDTNSGLAHNPIHFRGASSVGADDGTRPVITGASISSDNLFYINTIDNVRFENLDLTSATDECILGGTSSHQEIYFIDCKIHGGSASAGYCASGGDGPTGWRFIRCELYDNAIGYGGNRYKVYNAPWFIDCSIHDNTNAGLQFANTLTNIVGCLIYDNGGPGINIDTAVARVYSGYFLKDSTIFGNGGDGIFLGDPGGEGTSAGSNQILNCIISGNGGYGINFETSPEAIAFLIDGLCSYGNTSGHSNLTLEGDNIVYEDPNFVTETDGSEDLTPQNSNLSIARAFGAGGSTYGYMGAIQPEASGGGLLVHPGMSGGLGA